MPTGQITQAVQHLRRVVLWRDGAGLSDGQLLEHFIERRDEAAFETLVRRHGPMVLGVCRRLLRNYHDADDAFQATFLVLVRKAASVAPREMVGNWLYGVAYQTALKGRAVAARQRARERQVTVMPELSSDPRGDDNQGAWQDLQNVLDQELNRLPAKYRVPFVLCDLEGKSYKEAARQLGWPEGTFSVRLARARQMLAKRLTRYGFSITGAALAALVSEKAASASLPPSMISSTIKAAGLLAVRQVAAAGVVSGEVAALTKGVLKAMWLSKVKTAMAVVLTMSVVGLSGGAISYSLWAGEEEGPKGQQEKSSPAVKQADDGANNKNAAQTDKDKLQGVWKLVRLEALGHVFGADKLSEIGNLAVNGDWIYTPNREAPEFRYLQFHYWVEDIERVCTLAVRRWQGTYELDSSTNPKRITITDCANYQRHDWMGIYALDEDELRLCLSEKGWVREIPSEFKAKEGSSFIFFTFKREKPSDAQKKKEPFERFYTGGFQSIQGFEFRGVDKTDEKRFRQYEVKCTLVGVGPSGTDFGADGTGKILADPVLIIPEGKERRILSGGQQAVPGDKDNAVEFLDLGVSVRVKVIGLTDDRVRLETALERTEVNSADQKGVLVRGKSVRSIARVKLGETVKLVEKDDRGEARYWVRVKVVKVENVVSRTAPGKADGNKRPSFQEIARRLGLSDIQTFLFAEAVQGYTDAVPISDVARDFGMKEIDVFLLTEALRRDAVADGSKRPTFQEVARRLGVSETNLYIIAEALQGGRPLSDVARNFGMKEIDVFLLQEALQRDIADKRDAADKAGNQEGRHKKGNQSGLNYRLPNGSPVALDFGFPINKGPADNKQPFKASGDFIFLNSLEYQIPISRNDQQQFSFWVGFFGH